MYSILYMIGAPPEAALQPDPELTAAYEYGAAARPGLSWWAWGDVSPLLLRGWLIWHGAVCTRPYVHDARLTWPAVRAGWQSTSLRARR
jgi:hypothetical protein